MKPLENIDVFKGFLAEKEGFEFYAEIKYSVIPYNAVKYIVKIC